MRRPLKIKDLWNDTFAQVIDGFVDNVTDYFPGWTLDEIKFSFENDIEWNHGERWAAPIIYKLKEKVDPDSNYKLNVNQNNSLGKRLNLHYRDRWNHLSELWQQEYDPLHNYLDEYIGTKTAENHEITLDVSQLSGSNILSVEHGRVETRELDREDKVTHDTIETRHLVEEDVNRKKKTDFNDSNTKTDTEIRVHEDDINENVQTANWIAGYNSTGGSTDSGGVFSDRSHEHTYDTDDKQKDYVQSGTVKNEHDGDITETHSGSTKNDGTIEKDGSDTTAMTGTDTLTRSGTDTHTETFGKQDSKNGSLDGTETTIFNLTHRGNIGNIYTQDMFNKDIELWKKTFYNLMLQDILDYISLGVYD